MSKSLVASGYKIVWLFALFDLPVDTKVAKKHYVRFRSLLLDEGFSMLQFSVYARFCPGEDVAKKFRKKIKAELPPEGQVRLLMVTDRQFEKMDVFYGKKRDKVENPPEQMMLF